MAISIVGTPTTGSASGATSVSVNKPTGTAEGNLMILVHTVDWGTYSAMTAPAGWTLISGASHDESGGTGGHVKTWYKVAGASEGASYTFNQGTGADGGLSLITLAGHETTPTLVSAGDVSTGDTAPSVTPTGSDDFLICVATASQDDNTRTYTAPSGMTERTDLTTQYTSQSMATLQLASSSATGTKDFGATGAVRTGHQFQLSIAVRTASAGSSVTGAAVASFGFTGTAAGVPETFGVAAAALGFTGTAAGVDRALGAAAASFGFTATASGTIGSPPVTGAAAAAFGFTGSASGTPRALGVAAASFGFTGTAAGVDRALGVAAVAFGGTFTAAGVDRSLGVAAASFGFAGTATGSSGTVVTGAAAASFTGTFTAAGVDQTLGVATAAFGYIGTASGIDRCIGVAVATFGPTATTAGQRRTFGVATAAFTFNGTAIGVNLSIVTPPERTVVVPPETRDLVVPAEDRVLTVPPENRTLEA